MARDSHRETDCPGLPGDCVDPLFADHHALLIGVSKYEHQDRIDWTLNRATGANCDAEALRQTLESLGYPPSQIHCLCDEAASLEAIRQKLNELAAIWRVGLLFVFWAGHGVRRMDQERSYLLPYGADLDDLERTAVPVDVLIQVTRDSRAENKAIFLDTCHSVPKSDLVFLIEWNRLGLITTDPSLTFVGASSLLALAQAGRGGILTACLREALRGEDAVLCDHGGAVHLDNVMFYLQEHLERRAQDAWEKSGRNGRVAQFPKIVRQLGKSVPVGRNVSFHVRRSVEQSQLPEPLRRLAEMVINTHWAGGNDR